MLVIKHISIRYKEEEVVQAQQLTLQPGQLVALVGRNGSGKSSVIKGMMGQNPFLKGEIRIEQKLIQDYKAAELSGLLAAVFTEAPYPAIMKIEEFVAFGRYPFNNWFGRLRAKDLALIDHLLEECQLRHLKGKSMDQLSDGERQRVMIARALAQESKVLLLDEPSTHLDGKNTISILKLLRKQAKENGKAVLFSTHRIVESLELADQLWIIHRGNLAAYTKEEFLGDAELQKEMLGEHIIYQKKDGKHGFEINLS